MPPKNSKEFLERKELIEIQADKDKQKHLFRMEELAYIRETEKISHNHELERGRIKSAEIRKMQERKELMNMRRNG